MEFIQRKLSINDGFIKHFIFPREAQKVLPGSLSILFSGTKKAKGLAKDTLKPLRWPVVPSSASITF